MYDSSETRAAALALIAPRSAEDPGPTQDEVDAILRRTRPIHGFTRCDAPAKAPRSRVGWARCNDCGKVIQASGLGVGSHRRAHRRQSA